MTIDHGFHRLSGMKLKTQLFFFLNVQPERLPLAVGHLHGLQLGVGSSVEAFHLLLLQPLQQPDGILVDAAPLGQHQRR